jgi:hypothetical protein
MDRRQSASLGCHFIEVLQGQGRDDILERLNVGIHCLAANVQYFADPRIEATSVIKTPTGVLPLFGGDRQNGECITMPCPRVAQAPLLGDTA